MDQTQIASPVTKVVIAWGGVAVSFTFSWGDVAAILASLYTTLMISEWLWKRVGRPICVNRGWLAPKNSYEESL